MRTGGVSSLPGPRRSTLLAVFLAGMLGGCGSSGGETGGTGGSNGGATGGGSGSGGSSDGSGGNSGTVIDGGAGGAGGVTMPDAASGGSDARDSAAGGDARAPDATDGGGPDAATAYNPCPAKGTACVIMPLGDSITQGAPNPPAGGYRVPLFHLARMNDQTITFVGSGVDGPAMVDGVAFPRAHEGHSGFNIDATMGRQGISAFFPQAIATYKPHIVLLMIGTNDVDTGTTDIPMRLAKLMDTILGADPSLLLVVAQIVPQQTMTPDTLNQRVQAYNAAIAPLVKARADAGKHVRLVDMYGAFSTSANPAALLADRLHPTPAGFQVMADVWYRAIGPLLR